ncbi:interleukin-1 receptor antagonist protein-like [Sorex fumeus]|uniref:interleukin-1 receptor antagonist protein-like n=1 Tax=Sorex fumeus TaxID=62283 RepID=UPI0024AE3FA7|nr:interleukin-1 receptor antagonist protein-like [Sorex fumeus]
MDICKNYSHLIALLFFLCHPEASRFTTKTGFMKVPSIRVLLLFRIWDLHQKVFYLRNNQLFAGHLQGANSELEVKLDFVKIEPYGVSLGIHGRTLCLSCVNYGDKVRLELEPVDINYLSNKEQDKRFIFIYSEIYATSTFESVACPGWYLCTSQEVDQPVSLTNTLGEDMITDFYLELDLQLSTLPSPTSAHS